VNKLNQSKIFRVAKVGKNTARSTSQGLVNVQETARMILWIWRDAFWAADKT